MKPLTCLWFISLFCCCFSRENLELKCGSPTCDEIISNAKVLIAFNTAGISIKRGDTVEILGKSDTHYFVKHGIQNGLVPKTFLKESSVLIAGEKLVNSSEKLTSKFKKKTSNAPSSTPPLGNELVDADALNNIPATNNEEISSSKPYEVIDGTTLFLEFSNKESDETKDNSSLESPDLLQVKAEPPLSVEKDAVSKNKLDVIPKDTGHIESKEEDDVEDEDEDEDDVDDDDDDAEDSVENKAKNKVESNVQNKIDEVVDGTVPKVENNVQNKIDEVVDGTVPEVENNVQNKIDEVVDGTVPKVENNVQNKIDEVVDGTVPKVENNVQNKIDEVLDGMVPKVVKVFKELFRETEDIAEKSSKEEPSLGKEPKGDDVDNIQIPSTADLVGVEMQNTQLYEPTPTIFPSKTIESSVEATAQPALVENAEETKSVESLITSTENEALFAQEEKEYGGSNESSSEEQPINDSAATVQDPNLDSKEELSDAVESSTIVPSPEGFSSNDTISDHSPNTTIPNSSQDNAVAPDEPTNASTLLELNISTVSTVQIVTGFSPTALPFQQSVPLSTTINKSLAEFTELPETGERAASNAQGKGDLPEIVKSIVEPQVPETESLAISVNEIESVTIYNEVNGSLSSNESFKVSGTDSDLDKVLTDSDDSLISPVIDEQTLSNILEVGNYSMPQESSEINETDPTVPSREDSETDTTAPSHEKPETDTTAPSHEEPETDTTAPSHEEPETDTTAPIHEKPETDTTAPSHEEPVVEINDSMSLGISHQMYKEVTESPSLALIPEKQDGEVMPSSEKLDTVINEVPREADPENIISVVEKPVITTSKNAEDILVGSESFGVFDKVLEVGYDSISNLRDSSFFGFLSTKTQDDIQSVWHDDKLDSSNYPFDDTCKIGASNCPTMKEEEKIMSPAMDIVEPSSSEFNFSSFLDPLLNSKCMKAQSLLIFLTTAVVLVLSAFCYFYFAKRSKDASFYQKIDSLEKQLFISKKEALEYENRFNSVSSNLGGVDADSALLVMNSVQISELEAQRNELSEKVELLENELSATISLNKGMEKRLQEVLSSTQNTEMIFKTVDQLQQRIEMQQKSSIELNVQLKNKDKTIEGLEESLQKTVVYVNKLEEIVTALKKENETLSIESSGKIINLNSELEQVKSEKTLETTKLKAEIDSLKLSLEQARSSLEVAEANIIELKAIISDDAKNVDNMGDIFNGSELKAKLAVSELNIEKLKDRLQEETGARQFLEDHVTSVSEALNQLKASYSKLEKEKQEAENTVRVLKDYFKKQEEELKKEIEEKSAFQLQKDEETLFIKLKTLEEEKSSLKEQIEEMKKEIVEQENLFKRERVQLEKKADDNWLLSRQINRKLQDAKQESAVLRSRLTSVEKFLNEKNEQDPNDNDQSMTNGEGMQQQPNISSPSMLLNFPNTTNSSFAKFNNSDLILPPPLGLPGNEFIPPPPIYPDLRLPPVGGVGRMHSPPRGMTPPLSLETSFGLNFSPPPPMPSQYYYYHRSDSPSDYDSSYSKGERYRGDSPSNMESSSSSKTKVDPSRKVSADQPDSYPSSNPVHPSPLKPVARNPTSSGQKGWSLSGQSSKPVEKNSRKSTR